MYSYWAQWKPSVQTISLVKFVHVQTHKRYLDLQETGNGCNCAKLWVDSHQVKRALLLCIVIHKGVVIIIIIGLNCRSL